MWTLLQSPCLCFEGTSYEFSLFDKYSYSARYLPHSFNVHISHVITVYLLNGRRARLLIGWKDQVMTEYSELST